jgi:hypothetical protein
MARFTTLNCPGLFARAGGPCSGETVRSLVYDSDVLVSVLSSTMISSSSLFGRVGGLPLPLEVAVVCWTAPLIGLTDLTLAGEMALRRSSASGLGAVLGDVGRPLTVGFGVVVTGGWWGALLDGRRDKFTLDA